MFGYTKLMQAMSGVAAAVSDAFFNLVTLLLNTTATNGAQNNTFLDSSTNNFTITRNGNTTQGTFTPFSQTGWGNYFDGATNSYLALPSNTAFAFGTGAYTVEGWLYQTARSTNEALFFGANGGSGYLSYITNTGAVNSGSITGSAGDIPLNTWCHVAFVRNSTGTNDTKIYVNGVVKATGTDATNWTNSGDPRIGMLTANTNYAIKGYISNFRIVKGTAVYTSAFTPPTTPLTAISGTSVLTCQSNRFLDISSNAFTVTPTGTMSVQAFSPFLPTIAYDAAVVGGSGYFDGTDDSLSVPSNAAWMLGTGDFTIETWIYISTIKSFELLTVPGTGAFFWQYQNTTPQLQFGKQGGGGSITSSWTPVANTWYHVAISRVSGTTTQYINGVSIGSTASAIDVTGTGILAIGEGGGGDFAGYFSGLRIVKGSAVYTGNFAVPTAPPTAVTNTQLLVNYTNAGIFDSTAKNVMETGGNAQVSTTTAKWGTTSMYFDGTGDYLQLPASQNFLFNGDFTIEGWFNRDNGVDQSIFVMNTSGANYFAVNIAATEYTIYLNTSNGTFTAAVTLSNNTWYHFALVRSGSAVTLYHNGTSVGTATNSSVLGAATAVGYVGGINGGLKAYIDDLRITKYARYTANFSVPTAAFPLQ